MFVARAYVPDFRRPDQRARGEWPYTIPAVARLLDEGLEFTRPVTILVGDNGSGKSTIVEAIAEGFRLDSHGGRASALRGRPDRTKTPLGEVMLLDTTAAGARMLAGPRLKKRGFFLRAETAFSMTENLGGTLGYWDADTAAMSHGEGYLEVFNHIFAAPGFYVLDEPEAPLSFTASLRLVALMHELAQTGAQVVCATHSPILASLPGADVIQLDEDGFHRTTWDELTLVDHWRRCLNNPDTYLRHLTAEDDPA
ncbi:ABC transporter, ATP-binding protein [Actinorhabdospora filicis]|uniref:ABC transporter, ATP-binding protein n=1 Tax=Actinorhabdospora filicis TaxID=1785913 RepID=A0A9W6SLB5_9ACTN|nr:AAA family ATPase [Actinorhabdospora filicis]GLZ78027.1 ABC transporter, ATP-binding protein [Actinorhabdospora filicis]